MNTKTYMNLLARYRYLVIIGWVALAIVAGALFAPQLTERLTSNLDPEEGTESYEGQQLMQTYFPEVYGEEMHIIVLYNSEGILNPVSAAFTAELSQRIQQEYPDTLTGLGAYYIFAGTAYDSTKSQFVSEDNCSTIITVQVKGGILEQREVVKYLKQQVDDIISDLSMDSYQVYVTGVSALDLDGEHVFEEDLARIDMITIPLIILALAYLFRNLRYAFFSFIPIVISIIITFASIERFIAISGVGLETYIPSVIISLTLGIGIDYDLFLLSRYQEEKRKGKSKQEAVELMLRFAGHTVFTSGLTLIISLTGLIFFPLSILSSIGIGISIAVLVLLLVNLTFTPALLLIFGNALDKNDKKEKPVTVDYQQSFWYRIGKFAIKHGKLILVLVLLVSIPIAVQILNSNPNAELMGLAARNTESTEGLQMVMDEFSPGFVSPTSIIVVPKQDDVWNELTFSRIQSFISQAIEHTKLVGSALSSHAWLEGQAIPHPMAMALISPTSPLYNTSDSMLYRMISSNFVSSTEGYENRAVLISVLMDDDPLGYESTEIIRKLNELTDEIFADDFEVGFLGFTQVLTDAQDQAYAYFPVIILIIIIVIYIFLAIMFKAYLLPIRLIIATGLTLSMIYGAATIVFQYDTFLKDWFPLLEDVDYLYWMIPIMSFSIILGLGLDYDIFTLERIREKVFVEKLENKEAIAQALSHTGSIITGAGLIMMIAFGGLMFSSSIILVQFGFILAFAVFLDTFLVRTILLPAIMGFADKWNWWPSKVE